MLKSNDYIIYLLNNAKNNNGPYLTLFVDSFN